MSEPFLSEIKMVAFNFPPRGWAFCDGQLLPINQNQSLYSLLGTTYGGDGRTSFALPDLRGRAPLHFGTGFVQGVKGGEEGVTLLEGQLPQHRHTIEASSDNAANGVAANQVFARATANLYHAYSATAANTQTINPDALSHAGNGAAHNNMQPYLTIQFCIATTGVFPSRN